MTKHHDSERLAQDGFQSMVGETGPYPNDPQHPDPGFDVTAQAEAPGAGGACDATQAGGRR